MLTKQRANPGIHFLRVLSQQRTLPTYLQLSTVSNTTLVHGPIHCSCLLALDVLHNIKAIHHLQYDHSRRSSSASICGQLQFHGTAHCQYSHVGLLFRSEILDRNNQCSAIVKSVAAEADCIAACGNLATLTNLPTICGVTYKRTSPKTTCLPSSQGVGTVHKKNWLPLVLGPEHEQPDHQYNNFYCCVRYACNHIAARAQLSVT